MISKEYQKEYYSNNLELYSKNKHLRRTREKFKIGNITARQIKQIYERDQVCVYCSSDEKLGLDHIIALSKEDGNSTFYNYVVACGKCNNHKHTKDVFIFCKEQGIEVPGIINELLDLQELNKQSLLVVG